MDLGPLEMRVLGLLDADDAASVADVRSGLARRGHPLAYTTVLTVLSRLHDKGVVRRERQGRRMLYRLTPAAPRVKQDIVGRVQRALFDNDRLRPLVALLDAERLSEAELRELRALIDARLDDRGES
ncbi:MAG: BlaI/MecI/CopY family transcriptional regulator [Polyangiaceae bacterium]